MSRRTLQTLKGFRDFLPREALKRRWLQDLIRGVCERWGYDPLETPTLEALEVFQGQIGEDEKLFFTFQDPGGKHVALRYDQTVPTCRVVGRYHAQLPFPFRRYQMQPAFRAENTQRGRYREFLQIDADIFGVSSPASDAEVIALSLDIFKSIGFAHVKVLINDRNLLKDFPYDAIVSLDKIKKIGEDGVLSEMERRGIGRDAAREYFARIRELKPNETLSVIFDSLRALKFPDAWFAFDPTIARSFSYSTGPIWEIVIPGFDGGSVLGGERFDTLVSTVAGVTIPGTGFGLGFDRTLEAAEHFGLLPSLPTTTAVLVTVFSPSLFPASLRLAAILREQGIHTELFPDPEVKLDKQLKYANAKGIPSVTIIGPEEHQHALVTVKTLRDRTQRTIPIDQLASFISNSPDGSGAR